MLIPKEFKGNLKWNLFLKRNKGKIKSEDKLAIWASERREISWWNLLNKIKLWKSLDCEYNMFEPQLLLERWNIKENVCYELESQRANDTLKSPSKNMQEKRFKINSSLHISEVSTMKYSHKKLNKFELSRCISFWDDLEDNEEKYNKCLANLNLTIGDILSNK